MHRDAAACEWCHFADCFQAALQADAVEQVRHSFALLAVLNKIAPTEMRCTEQADAVDAEAEQVDFEASVTGRVFRAVEVRTSNPRGDGYGTL